MDDYKFSNLTVTNSSLSKFRISVIAVSYERSPWKYVIASMALYALWPVVMPIMILLSKLLKRKIEWFPIEGG